MENTQFDTILLGLAQQISASEGPGIDPILTTFLGFLRRKTDFFNTDQTRVKLAMTKAMDHQFKLLESDKANAAREAQRINHAKNAEKGKNPSLAKKQPSKVSKPIKTKTASGNFSNVEIEMLDDTDSNVEKVAQSVTASKSKEPQNEEEENEEDKGKLSPNLGNGGNLDKYAWTQTLTDVNVSFSVPANIKRKDVVFLLSKSELTIGLRGQSPIVSGKLHDEIKVDDATWTLEDSPGGIG